jgi:hypothetical protein
VILMVVLGVLLVVGIVLTIWWGGAIYESWDPAGRDDPDHRPSLGAAALRYLRGVAVALVGGFWAGLLVTGPAIRLIMRLLAATAGEGAQGAITEAEEVVGRINVDGTIGLLLFGGVLPGLLSGGIYVVVRRWLPAGRLGGVAFGVLHLVVAATRIDPLRPDNPDFDLVGPGWLSVTTFALAAVLHGMAVVAIANRYSATLPPRTRTRAHWARAVAPLVIPVLLLVPGAFLLLPLLVGLAITVLATQVAPLVGALRSRAALVVGRVALVVLFVALLPGAALDLRDVVVRPEVPAVSTSAAPD